MAMITVSPGPYTPMRSRASRMSPTMAGLKGFTPQLQTLADLVGKLRHDARRVKRNPQDAYAAFDFVVTADSLHDWLGLPSNYDPPDVSPMGIVHHLAIAMKHRQPANPKLQAVRHSDKEPGYFDPDYFRPDAFDVGEIVITLDSGHTKRMRDLVDEVMEWAEHQPGVR